MEQKNSFSSEKLVTFHFCENSPYGSSTTLAWHTDLEDNSLHIIWDWTFLLSCILTLPFSRPTSISFVSNKGTHGQNSAKFSVSNKNLTSATSWPTAYFFVSETHPEKQTKKKRSKTRNFIHSSYSILLTATMQSEKAWKEIVTSAAMVHGSRNKKQQQQKEQDSNSGNNLE